MGDQQESDSRAAEQPMDHAFVLFGTKSFYLSHSAMFLTPEHAYQAIVEVDLSDEARSKVASFRADNPQTLVIVLSKEKQVLEQLLRGSFDVNVYRDGIDPNNIFTTATVTPKNILYYNKLDQSSPDYPGVLSYIMFGRDEELFMSHLITRRPNFHHEVTLQYVPIFDPAELAKGMRVNIPGHSDGFYDTDPLPNPAYDMSVPPNGHWKYMQIVRRDRFTYKVLNGEG